jgi:diguanylate cyclase (GGDEF)-like protein
VEQDVMKIEANIDELVKLVSTAIEAYTTAFFLADNQRRLLKLWHYYSLGDNVIDDATIPFGYGPIGWVAENHEPFDLSKFSTRDSSMLGLYSKNEDIKSFYAVPITRGDVLEGVLCVDSKRAFVFARKDQTLLSLFARQFADLLNNVRVQKFVNTEASDVASLHGFCRQMASADSVEAVLQLTLNSVKQLVECDGYFLSLKTDDEDGGFRVEEAQSYRNIKGTTFSDQDGLAGYVIRRKESFLLPNRKGDFGSYVFVPSKPVERFRSFLGIPLMVKEEVLGLICLIDGRVEAYNQRDLRVVSIIADNISLAISNIKAQEKANSLLTDMDGLTGLYNFCGFQKRLEEAFREASQRRRPLSLMIMDLNNFREINKLLGYETGNEVLRKFARLLMNLSSDESISASRYGSDEFALILPGLAREQALFVAERLHKAMEDSTFVAPSYGVHVTASIGISSFSQSSGSCNDLMDNALNALSLAKTRRSGRAIC